MDACNQVPLILPKMQDQKSLTLRWCSLWKWGSKGIAVCSANTSGQKVVYDWLQPISGVITQDARPKIIDAPLTLIFMNGLGVFRFLFELQRLPILRLWQRTTCRPQDYPKYTNNNCWCSVDAHFWDVVGRVSQFILIIKAANTSKSNNDVPMSTFCDSQ